jgi:Flp pilus assembly protein TadB
MPSSHQPSVPESTEDETRWELSAVAIVLALCALLALVGVGMWIGGVGTLVIIVGLPVIAIVAVTVWLARASRRAGGP